MICAGIDPQLLESRRLVLQAAGFEATCVSPAEALKALTTSPFDFMIISVSVSEKDREALRAAASGNTRVIQLHTFTAPQELLALLRP
ncbi:hypothetical protein ACPOL_6974 (plasmid) [Acidisarcina polymorpha]|uniref:Response regulatory domain-containing protein n=1 Tax=Acidisarcina polymorpha TaxID=2211140 RepID=A0A2Z5GB12_9BACT|nr:hypothetical protein ACPOL_6974 [Acidisarcina polymorpha]